MLSRTPEALAELMDDTPPEADLPLAVVEQVRQMVSGILRGPAPA